MSLFDLNGLQVPSQMGPTGAYRVVDAPRVRSLVSMMWYRYSNPTGNLARMRAAITRIESLPKWARNPAIQPGVRG